MFGKDLRRLRNQAGLTREELSRATFARDPERGICSPPSPRLRSTRTASRKIGRAPYSVTYWPSTACISPATTWRGRRRELDPSEVGVQAAYSPAQDQRNGRGTRRSDGAGIRRARGRAKCDCAPPGASAQSSGDRSGADVANSLARPMRRRRPTRRRSFACRAPPTKRTAVRKVMTAMAARMQGHDARAQPSASLPRSSASRPPTGSTDRTVQTTPSKPEGAARGGSWRYGYRQSPRAPALPHRNVLLNLTIY